MQSIPETIGGLSELRLLDLSGCSALTGLPESLTKLGALVRLNLLGCSNLSSLPGKFSQLSSLQVRPPDQTLSTRDVKLLRALLV